MEKPILFSTEMVRAILDGRKTQTRRVVKPSVFEKGTNWFWNPNENICLAQYRKGDVLWVRETWAKDDTYYYKADGSCGSRCGKWKPSIHMPREAARIFLRVTNIRVERLQDITDDDAWKEGFERDFPFCEKTECDTCLDECSARYKFNKLWDNLNAKRGCGWAANPWVWVIEFERIAA